MLWSQSMNVKEKEIEKITSIICRHVAQPLSFGVYTSVRIGITPKWPKPCKLTHHVACGFVDEVLLYVPHFNSKGNLYFFVVHLSTFYKSDYSKHTLHLKHMSCVMGDLILMVPYIVFDGHKKVCVCIQNKVIPYPICKGKNACKNMSPILV